MNKKFILLGEQFLVIIGLQILVLHYLKAVVVPSFFLIWLLILVWEGNTEIALFMAFVTGIVYDIISRGFLGTTSIIFLVIVYTNCFLKIQGSAGRIVGVFIFSVICFLLGLFKYPEGFLWNAWTMIKYSLLFAFYNSVIYLLIDAGMKKLRLKWKMRKGYLSI